MEKTNKGIKKERTRNLAILFLIIFTVIVLNVITNSSESRISDVRLMPEISNIRPVDIKTKKVYISDIDISNELILVNCENTIDESFTVNLSTAYGVIPLSTGDIKMNSMVLEAVNNMFEKAKEKGYKNFLVTSGFRSYQKQKELFDKTEDKSYVQKPGASEHQTGYALDIAYTGLSGEMFDNTPQGKWLIENAYKYGFILRYPEDKSEITKINYEPWHYRYIGIPHAYYCYQNKLCLEEYISFLSKGGSYSVSIDMTTYNVYYETEKDGFINVPVDKSYVVSSDNMGGYIIVIKE